MERMRLHLLPEFQAAGAETFLVVGQLQGELVDLVPSGVPVIEIAPRGPLQFFPGLVRALRKHRPTHILSAADDVNVLAILANRLARTKARIVVSNHNTLSEQISRARGLQFAKLSLTRTLMRWFYPRADGIVAVSQGVADDLAVQLRLPRDRIRVIYNPTIDREFRTRMMEPLPSLWPQGPDPVILFAGRLVPQKRLDVLLDAFAVVRERQAAHLVIAGKGPLQNWLETEITRRGWPECVTLAGFVPNILPLIRASAVLVLSSDHEGLPNILIEALGAGTQIVSTDCPNGPREILGHGTYGQVVQTSDPPALGAAITRSLSGAFWVPPELLISHSRQFTADLAARHYLSALRDPTNPKIPSNFLGLL